MTVAVVVVSGAHLQAHVDGEGGGRWGSQQAFGQGHSGAPGVARLLRIAAADPQIRALGARARACARAWAADAP